MMSVIKNNAEVMLRFESCPMGNSINHRPYHQFPQASSNSKSFDPVIGPSKKSKPPLPMLNSSQNDDLAGPLYTLFKADSPKPTQTKLKNQGPAMQVNNMFVENMVRSMQPQHHQKLIPNKLRQFEANAFAHLVGNHSHGTGVFHPPNPYFTNNIPFQIKIGMMQRKQEVGFSPLRNPYQARENSLAKQKESAYDSLPLHINLPKEGNY